MKKYFILIVLQTLFLSSFAQTDSALGTPPLAPVKKMNPLEFIHKNLLNPDAQIQKLPADVSTTTKVFSWLQEKYASSLKVFPNSIENLVLYTFIDEWYGVRYRYGGTTKRGVDCSSFVQQLYRNVFDKSILRTAAAQYSTMNRVKRHDLKEGDLVFFRIKTSRISHVGVYLQNDRFVHSSSSSGVHISNLNSSYWKRYYAGGGRVTN